MITLDYRNKSIAISRISLYKQFNIAVIMDFVIQLIFFLKITNALTSKGIYSINSSLFSGKSQGSIAIIPFIIIIICLL